jgi:hypothetical protein
MFKTGDESIEEEVLKMANAACIKMIQRNEHVKLKHNLAASFRMARGGANPGQQAIIRALARDAELLIAYTALECYKEGLSDGIELIMDEAKKQPDEEAI